MEPEQERLNGNAQRIEGELDVAVVLLPARAGVDQLAVDEVLHAVIARTSLELDVDAGRMPLLVGQARGDHNRVTEIPVVSDVDGLDVNARACVSQRDEPLPAASAVVSAHRDPRPRLINTLCRAEAEHRLEPVERSTRGRFAGKCAGATVGRTCDGIYRNAAQTRGERHVAEGTGCHEIGDAPDGVPAEIYDLLINCWIRDAPTVLAVDARVRLEALEVREECLKGQGSACQTDRCTESRRPRESSHEILRLLAGYGRSPFLGMSAGIRAASVEPWRSPDAPVARGKVRQTPP